MSARDVTTEGDKPLGNIWAGIVWWRSPGAFSAPAELPARFNEHLGGVSVMYASGAFQFTNMPSLGRGSAKEMLVFVGREVVRRVGYGSSRVVSHEGQLCAVTVDDTGNAATVIFSDKYRPHSNAVILAEQILQTFVEQHGRDTLHRRWAEAPIERRTDTRYECAGIMPLLKMFETRVGKVAQIQQQVDAVRDITVENYADLLQRDEKVETMMARADGLSTSTRVFLKETRKLKKCGWASCTLL